jgi:hypothetical protein
MSAARALCGRRGNARLRNWGPVLAAVLTGLVCPGVEARKAPMAPGTERFKFWGGVGIDLFDTQVQARAGGSVVGVSIDLEDDLGLEERLPEYGFGGEWRFRPRQRLRATYTSFSRGATTVLDRSIEIGDEVFPIGAQVDSNFDISLTSFDYLYSLLKRSDFELSASGGIYWATMRFDITAEAQAGPVLGGGEYSTKGEGPLPALGFRAAYYIDPRWSLNAAVKAFFISISDIKGQLVSLGLGTEYYFTRHVGIGGSIESLRLDAKIDDDKTPWELDVGYLGPQIYFVGKF